MVPNPFPMAFESSNRDGAPRACAPRWTAGGRRLSVWVLAIAVIPGLVSCASSGGGKSPSERQAAAAAAMEPGLRAEIEGYWKLYQENDPGWPAARERWLAKEPATRNILVESLIHDLIRRAGRAAPAVTERTMKELAILDDLAVPHLIAAGDAGDEILRQQTAEILGWIGEPSVEPILESLRADSRDDGFRRYKVEVLGVVKDPRAADTVTRLLHEDDDWAVRAAAATAAGRIGGSAAVDELARALQREEDEFVLERIAAALGGFADPRAIDALVSGLRREASRDDMRLRIARECSRSLRRITGERIGTDPAAWRSWWNRNRESFTAESGAAASGS